MSSSQVEFLSDQNSTSGSLPTSQNPPANQIPPNLTGKNGIVLYVENLAGTDTVVWSDDQFYRIPQDSVPFRLKPMTPILFNTTHSISRPIGKFSSPTFEGSFVSLHTSSAIRVVGSFSKTYLDKVTFSFNPNNLLTHPSQATFHAQSYSFDSPVEVLIDNHLSLLSISCDIYT